MKEWQAMTTDERKAAGWNEMPKMMKRIIYAIVGFVLLSFMISRCDDSAPASTTARSVVSDSVMLAQKAHQKDSAQKVVDALKSKFIFEKDEFQDGGFYYHKQFGKNWPHRKTLMAHVSQSGRIYLISNYWADDWIFHEQVQVKIDSTVFTTSPVSRFEKANHQEVVNGGLYEVIYYLNDPLADGILIAIASAPTASVSIRFLGPQYRSDAKMSAADVKALVDCYNLARALRITNE